jgi:hypothetical protein
MEARLSPWAAGIFRADPYSPLKAGASGHSVQSGTVLGRPIRDGNGFLSFFSSVFSFFTGFSFSSAGFFSPVFCFAD